MKDRGNFVVVGIVGMCIKEKGIQVNTLETVHSVLHPTSQMAVRDNIIRINPSDGVMAQVKKRPGKNHGVRHALTIEQQRAFMNYISENPVYCRWTPLVTVLLGTGCRIGEIIGLRWEDLDYEKRIISINHSVTYYPRREDTYKCEFQVSLPKTEAGIRNVPMMDEVYNAFKEEAVRQKEDTRFCENETNVKIIQAVMGHASIETTLDIYAEVTDMKKTEAIENLSRNLHIF